MHFGPGQTAADFRSRLRCRRFALRNAGISSRRIPGSRVSQSETSTGSPSPKCMTRSGFTFFAALCLAALLVPAQPLKGRSGKSYEPLPMPPGDRTVTPEPLPEFGAGRDFGLESAKPRHAAFPGSADLLFSELEIESKAGHFDKVIALCDATLQGEKSFKVASVILRFRGSAHSGKGQWKDALNDYAEALKSNPDSPWAFLERGEIYVSRGQWKLAAQDFKKAMHLGAREKEYYRLLNGFAWFRATCPKQVFRDGKEAARLARQACHLSHWQDPNMIDTLAAAYAENGDFQRACAFQEQAMWMDGVDEQVRSDMAKRLTLYREKQSYHPVEQASRQR